MVRNALQDRGTTLIILTFTVDLELLQWSEMLFRTEGNLNYTNLYCRSRALTMVRNALQDRETTLLKLTFTVDLELLQWSEMLFRTEGQPYLY